KRFADADLIPGGGAASAVMENDDAARHVLEELGNESIVLGEEAPDPVCDVHVKRAIELLPRLDSDRDARREYVSILRLLLEPSAAHADDASIEFFTADPEKLFQDLDGEVIAPAPATGGGATSLGDDAGTADAGGAAG